MDERSRLGSGDWGHTRPGRRPPALAHRALTAGFRFGPPMDPQPSRSRKRDLVTSAASEFAENSSGSRWGFDAEHRGEERFLYEAESLMVEAADLTEPNFERRIGERAGHPQDAELRF